MLYQDTFPGQVPLRSILPRGVDNLLVPVNLSATHVAWNTVRLEPTWMHLGEAAAWVAVLAVRQDQDPAAVARDALLQTLALAGVTLAFFNDVESEPGNELTAAVQYFATRGFFPSYDASLQTPVKAATAKLWVKAATESGESDPNILAQHVRAADLAPGPVIGRAEFQVLIPGGIPESDRMGAVLRGDLLLALWRLLPERQSPTGDH